MTKKRILAVGLSSNDKMRGVERVVFESIKAFSKYNEEKGNIYEIHLLVGKWQDYYNDLTQLGVKLIFADCSSKLLSRHFFCWFKLPFISRGYDVLHIYNSMPLLFSGAAKSIMTIHDVAEFAMPMKYSFLQSAYRRLILRYVIKVIDVVVTVSNFSKSEICKYLHLKDIDVIPNGLEHLMPYKDLKAAPNEFILSPVEMDVDINNDQFFLYFGVIEKTKGLDIALNAFVKFKLSYPEYEKSLKFVVAGQPGNLYNELKPYFSRKDVVYVGRVSDNQLQFLLKNTRAVFFLSEYEGFGFPASEAIMAGAQVLVTKGTVLEEVCYPFCYATEVSSIDSVVDAIGFLLNDRVSFNLTDAQTIMLSKYSWRNVALSLWDVYS